MSAYDHEHWEEMLRTVIDRIGVEDFLRVLNVVLEEKNFTAYAAVKDDQVVRIDGILN